MRTHNCEPTLTVRNISGFITGFRYSFSGFRLLNKPGVRLYILVPAGINTLVFASVIIYGADLLGEFIIWLTDKWSWLEWIAWLLWPLFLIFTLALVFSTFALLSNIIAAPFNSYLSLAVRRHITNLSKDISDQRIGLIREIIDTLRSEIAKFSYIVIRLIPLLILFLIPVVQLAAPAIWLLFATWMASLEYLEYPMANDDMTFIEIRAFLSKNRSYGVGFGLGTLLLTMLPIINFIAMPLAVTGATKLYQEQLKIE